MKTLSQHFRISDTAEITMEMNPCDMSEDYLKNAMRAGVNRISIGVQEKHDHLLSAIGRRHTAKEAETAVKRAYRMGFHNLSLDLMYELPGQTVKDFEESLRWGKLSEFKKLSDEKENQSTPKVSKNKIRLAQIDEEIGDLLSKVGSANSILMKYINDKVSELDAERQTLQEEIVSLTCSKTESKMGQITDHVKKWQDISFEDKQAVVDALIKVIKVANGNIEITWKI